MLLHSTILLRKSMKKIGKASIVTKKNRRRINRKVVLELVVRK